MRRGSREEICGTRCKCVCLMVSFLRRTLIRLFRCIVARGKENLDRVAEACRALQPVHSGKSNKVLSITGDIANPDDMVAVRDLIVKGMSFQLRSNRIDAKIVLRDARMERPRHVAYHVRIPLDANAPRSSTRGSSPHHIGTRRSRFKRTAPYVQRERIG